MRRSFAFALLALLCLPCSAAFGQSPSATLSATSAGRRSELIEDIDFGQPRFRHSASARRVFDEIIQRETQLLELGRWLSLDEAIEMALANNPDLAAAYSAVEGQRWSLIAARRRWYPSLFIGPSRDSTLQLGGSSRQLTTTTSATPDATTSLLSNGNQSLNTEVDLRWTFLDPTRGPAINAAFDELRAQRFLFNVAARNLVLDVQAAYFRLQAQMSLVDQYKLVTLLSTLQLDRAIEQQSGATTKSNQVEQLRTTQRANITQLIAAYVSLFEVSVEMSRLLALPGLSLVLASDSSEIEASWSDDIQTSVANAEAFREEIQAQLQQSQSQRWRSSELLAAYWPRLSLLGIGSLDGFSERSFAASNLAATNSSTAAAGTIGIALDWALFDGGIKAADAVNRKAAAQALALQAESTRLQVSAQVRQAYTRYVGAGLQVQNTDEEVKDSWNSFIGAIRLFRNQSVNATTLIQTQTQLVDAITDAAAARRQHNTSLAELYRYSARWPPKVQRLFDQRLQQLHRQGVGP